MESFGDHVMIFNFEEFQSGYIFDTKEFMNTLKVQYEKVDESNK